MEDTNEVPVGAILLSKKSNAFEFCVAVVGIDFGRKSVFSVVDKLNSVIVSLLIFFDSGAVESGRVDVMRVKGGTEKKEVIFPAGSITDELCCVEEIIGVFS